jgi:hypothetical protein
MKYLVEEMKPTKTHEMHMLYYSLRITENLNKQQIMGTMITDTMWSIKSKSFVSVADMRHFPTAI